MQARTSAPTPVQAVSHIAVSPPSLSRLITQHMRAASIRQPVNRQCHALLPHRCSRTTALPRCTARLAGKAGRAPCILITAPDGIDNCSLQSLAHEVRQQLGVQALIVAPAAHTAGPVAAASLTFQQQLQLQPHPDHELTFGLAGATAADCVLTAVDQTCGLIQALNLSTVLVLVGVARGPALSSDMDSHPAVAVARQAALLGLPAVAACLATTSAGAPMQPAVAATAALLAQLLPALQQSSNAGGRGSSRGNGTSSGLLSAARNFPRAHFPFPEEGRWALGTQLPLPQRMLQLEGSGSSSSSWEPAFDCWALGDDNSWLGGSTSSSSSSSSTSKEERQQELYRTLQGAFADGDLLLCLNVPPTWTEAAGFAATRPGVLWHCWQVEASHAQQQQQQQQESQPGADDGSRESGGRWSHLYSSSSSSSSSNSSRSWQVDGQDLYGRSLPSTSYNSKLPIGSNFVRQDNTLKVLAETQQQTATAYGSAGSWDSGGGREQQGGSSRLPSSFTVHRGTMLSDAAACGDVEAVFAGGGGRAAVTVCQAWPVGHPLSVRDELLLAALDEGPGSGLPSWLLAAH